MSKGSTGLGVHDGNQQKGDAMQCRTLGQAGENPNQEENRQCTLPDEVVSMTVA